MRDRVSAHLLLPGDVLVPTGRKVEYVIQYSTKIPVGKCIVKLEGRPEAVWGRYTKISIARPERV